MRRYCNPAELQPAELRNAQPPANERKIELLIYGIFGAFEGDKGYYSTAWVPLEDVLEALGNEVVSAKLASFRDGLATALTAALAPAPAADSPIAAAAAASPISAGEDTA